MASILTFAAGDAEKLKIAHDIRSKVFVEEQSVNPELELDEDDTHSTHFLLYVDKKAVGVSRFQKTTKGIKFQRIAVLKDQRKKGFGKLIVKEMICVAKEKFPNEIVYLHGQCHAKEFYESLGFEKEGEIFQEGGDAKIDHWLFVLKK
eukprot:gene5863-9691_t